MREILFRGKQVDNGEWVYGSYVFEPRRKGAFGQTISELDRERHYIVSKKNYEFWEVIPETVGQFTGLTDKNGTKIFERDIVSSNKRKTWIGRGKVWFGNGAFWCGEREWAKLLRTVCLEDEQAVVIGNVHDNPELLEVEE